MQNTYDERMAHEAADGAQAEAEAEMHQLDRGFSQAMWRQKGGMEIKVADMDYRHVKNCIALLERHLAKDPGFMGACSDDSDGAQMAAECEERHNQELREYLENWISHLKQEIVSREAGKDMTKIYNQVMAVADFDTEY